MTEEKPEQNIAPMVEKRYKSGIGYLRSMQFLDRWPEYERFKAGDQWPPPTERTKNLPRPVFNIIRYIQNHKVSSVMNENIKMIYTPQESVEGMQANDPQTAEMMKLADEAGEKFTRYSDTVWEEIKQDELNEEALESASNIGTGIWHYYWDTGQKGGLTQPYIGKMCGEVIDPINVFFGNPQQRDVQKQPYIIVSMRSQLSLVRREAKQNGLSAEMVAMIQPDKETQDEGYDRAKIEVDGSEKVTVLFQYWKEDDMIYMCKVASGQIVKKKTAMDFKLYPIAVMQWERRKKSIHGIGDTEGLIPNQKTINFLMAMSVLSVQLTGWPKAVINPSYVDPNTLNNDPSVPIIDNSPPGEKGIEYLMPGTVNGMARDLVESFMEHTRTLASAQDASTGDVGGSQLNASAIMLLQKAAGVPIESIKKRFYRAMEDIGRIWEEFWKVKHNTTRRVNLQDDDGNEYSDEMKGTDYAGIDLNLKIDIGPSSQYSEQLMMTSLDRLYDKQAISTEQYLEFAPKTVVPFKDRLLKQIREQQEMAAQMPQPDPQAEAAAQMEQQMAIKQQDHANKLELEQVKGNQQLQLAAVKSSGGG
ncbi:hypothetical protein [Paenibacillus harenae]|uniref:portal protein n=1 Tax=Paenibacillus harenae TaxID=306543 RepID=UPI00048CFCE8|nr:hypothetical protein [Paenibacillus harenae]